jgi:hypothetical protein
MDIVFLVFSELGGRLCQLGVTIKKGPNVFTPCPLEMRYRDSLAETAFPGDPNSSVPA